MRILTQLLCLVSASAAFAAPPEVPSELKARPGQLVRVVAKGEAEIGTLRSFNDSDGFFDELAPRKGERRFVFQSDKPGTYVIGFWSKGELEGVTCTIVVGDGKPAPIDPPMKPPTEPAGYFFLIVRPDGPADAKFTATMSLPAWQELKNAGHKFKDKTVTDAAADLGIALPNGTTVPCVFTLVVDGNVSKVLRGPVPLPTDAAGILKLAAK